ncbi:hypothetical protein [Bacillus sp. N1-1]|uniref:hypothetical protein n=1 Tax=Bacillus sp. N1-1 TaxID=2682541 RepID=UPI00131969E2|nr:hypothetical protein [Bacillus sp. N1-1]QHA92120.1 hypothetical protein GNK04_12175 [Bacillus sp. N1-1]
MNYKKRNTQKGKGKTATVMALSALGGAAAYALTNRMQNGGFGGMQQHSQQNSSHQVQSHSQHQNPESLKQMASAQGIDNDAIAEFTNAIKDDLR